MWTFDSNVVKIYHTHVRQHIPNYEKVISKVVSCCNDLCKKDDSILDFGSATGYTIDRLALNKFSNLTGVEISKDMIDSCDKNNATYYTEIPNKKFKAIIANWSLHFNFNKAELLSLISSSIDEGGFLFLSDKTIQNEYTKDRYYQLKIQHGVSWDEIKTKEKSLEGVMNINSMDWYFEKLKENGLKNIDIIDADWGFVTLIAFK
jgi:tRNA (cmo5U34)-methyltransferase